MQATAGGKVRWSWASTCCSESSSSGATSGASGLQGGREPATGQPIYGSTGAQVQASCGRRGSASKEDSQHRHACFSAQPWQPPFPPSWPHLACAAAERCEAGVMVRRAAMKSRACRANWHVPASPTGCKMQGACLPSPQHASHECTPQMCAVPHLPHFPPPAPSRSRGSMRTCTATLAGSTSSLSSEE